MKDYPKIGLSCLVIRRIPGEEYKILMGQRKGSHEAGKWSIPGGHLDPGETPFEGIFRELREEAGILRKDFLDMHYPEQFTWQYEEFSRGRYVDLVFKGHVKPDTEAMLMEPHKCYGWKWMSTTEVFLAELPLFQSLDKTLRKLHYVLNPTTNHR